MQLKKKNFESKFKIRAHSPTSKEEEKNNAYERPLYLNVYFVYFGKSGFKHNLHVSRDDFLYESHCGFLLR